MGSVLFDISRVDRIGETSIDHADYILIPGAGF